MGSTGEAAKAVSLTIPPFGLIGRSSRKVPVHSKGVGSSLTADWVSLYTTSVRGASSASSSASSSAAKPPLSTPPSTLSPAAMLDSNLTAQ